MTIKNVDDDRNDPDHVSQRMDSLRFPLAGSNDWNMRVKAG